MPQVSAYAAPSPDTPLAPFTIDRREPRANEVALDILYCGVCHSDLHTVRNEWQNTLYPCVPGHEIIGRVTAVGAQVSAFSVGDLAGVGCMIDSCQQCAPCQDGLEQYCETGFTGTYNGPEQSSRENTFGGYSAHIVVRDTFVLRITHPASDMAAVAPLLCAGITTYSPLREWNIGPGNRVGIVGLGGLGHMGVQIAAAMGAHVVLFTTSPGKRADALRLGAHEVVVSKEPDEMATQAGRLDFILNTVSAPHDLDAFLALLRFDGTMVLVGAPASPHPSPTVFNLIMKRRRIAGSLIGGIRETQEMLDFCAEHGIVSDIETIRMDQIEDAFDRMVKGDVKYRFVVDMASIAGG